MTPKDRDQLAAILRRSVDHRTANVAWYESKGMKDKASEERIRVAIVTDLQREICESFGIAPPS